MTNNYWNKGLAIDWGVVDALSVSDVCVRGGALELVLHNGAVLRITFAGGGLRMQIGVGTDLGIISGDINFIGGEKEDTDYGYCFTTKDHGAKNQRVEIECNPFCFRYYRGGVLIQQSGVDGHFSRRFRVPPFCRYEGAWLVSLNLGADEEVYGLGEKWGALNHRGSFVRSRNEDALGVNAEISYKNIPFAHGTEGWGYWVHGGSAVSHAIGFGPMSHRCAVIAIESNTLDMFIWGGNSKEIITRYCELIGFPEKPPQYSLGLIISRAFYQNEKEMLDVAQEIRDRKLPCDIITFDGRSWQDTSTRFLFEWDASRYPNPKDTLSKLKELNFEACNWEYPLVSIYNPRFNELEEKGYFLKESKNGKTYIHYWDSAPWNSVLTPLVESALIDFTNPEAYAFWRDEHKHIFEAGSVMLKPDFGEQVHDEVIASNGLSGAELHNVYSYLYNRCCWEAAKKFVGEKAFLFSRSAWSGSHKFPSVWGGDPQADFGGLAGSIRGSLSWGMSGGAFFATDIGGFYGDTRDPELFIRWCQMGVFSAHIRFHGIGEREPWSYGEDVFSTILELVKLRYRLIPYIEKCVGESCRTGLPVQRAMALAFSEDRIARQFDTQYCFGESLLVVPCIKAGGSVEFYLPEGDWLQFPNKTPYQGGRIYKKELALNEFLVFALRGTKIPLGKDVQHLRNGTEIESEWEAC